jgi:hypothetical protein
MIEYFKKQYEKLEYMAYYEIDISDLYCYNFSEAHEKYFDEIFIPTTILFQKKIDSIKEKILGLEKQIELADFYIPDKTTVQPFGKSKEEFKKEYEEKKTERREKKKIRDNLMNKRHCLNCDIFDIVVCFEKLRNNFLEKIK